VVVEFLMDISVTSWTQLVEPAATTASTAHAISGNNKTPREREFGSRESKTATPTTTKKCVRRKI
jgi:hypothetical protein